ncbi:VOC family protein [Nocardia abscessus]|jgi:methylmalonyl-CoA/ethylmalonyl-CoA epimerase|uniref:VOC family protein n=1 Tax=Nocardia TaxID=1817 RepID=UPI001893A86B|nr:VOC family protein [Nocardia abscessus]MBF6207907.1 VOC family protein [Streptomyces gardneri]MBF6472531.1 VOC family protein [Nocardia abscessus]
MGIKGINRIVVGVPDIDQAIAHYEKLLGATFERVPDEFCKGFGSRVAISWDAGIELVAPLQGPASDTIGLLPKRMGFMGIIFDVDDVEDAARTAEAAGARVVRELRLSSEQMNAVFGQSMTTFEEVALDTGDTGIPIVLGEIRRQPVPED